MQVYFGAENFFSRLTLLLGQGVAGIFSSAEVNLECMQVQHAASTRVIVDPFLAKLTAIEPVA